MAEWSKAPVLKTGDVKASVGSNPTLSANLIPTGYVQKYPSGRRGSPAKGVGCVKSAARVQIPPSAPTKSPRRQAGGFCWHLEGFEDELQWPAPMGPGLGATYGVCRRSAAGASDTPRGTSGLWSQCPWGMAEKARRQKGSAPTPGGPAAQLASAGTTRPCCVREWKIPPSDYPPAVRRGYFVSRACQKTA